VGLPLLKSEPKSGSQQFLVKIEIRSQFFFAYNCSKLSLDRPPGILPGVITGKGGPSFIDIRAEELFICSLYLLGVYIKQK